MHTKPANAEQTGGFADLDERGCLALLASGHIGHIGFTSGALPVVRPIRYRLVGRSLVFATESGVKLNSARRHAVACVEIEGTDDSTGTAWTVLATGRLREITDPSSVGPSTSVKLRPWGRSTDGQLVALDIELLSGETSKAR
jgi:hypothetical protein